MRPLQRLRRGTFDPSGPCSTDGRAAGAYPELEALVPREFQGRAPDKVDSGRNCTPTALATLALHDVSEMRFAGGIWDLGSNSGVTLAVFEAPGLEAAWVAEFFEAGARTARRVESVDVRSIVLPGGAAASRIDALNGESYQTVVVWPDGERVRVAIVASFIREVSTKAAHEAVVSGRNRRRARSLTHEVRKAPDTSRPRSHRLPGRTNARQLDQCSLDHTRRLPSFSAAPAVADPDRDRAVPDRPWPPEAETARQRADRLADGSTAAVATFDQGSLTRESPRPAPSGPE